jgi:glucose-6-phosphate 1-dehydrogenase
MPEKPISREMSDDDFHQHLRDGVDQFSHRGKAQDEAWNEFASHLSFLSADFGDPATYTALEKQLAAHDEEWNTKGQRIFYQATPPSLVETIVRQIGKARLAHERQRTRIVLESPLATTWPRRAS